MSADSPTVRVEEGGCLRMDGADGPKNGHVLVATNYYDCGSLLGLGDRRTMCAVCGAFVVVNDRTYARALLADAAYLRDQCGEGDATTCPETGADIDFAGMRATATEWERIARVIAPDERQLGLGVGERR